MSTIHDRQESPARAIAADVAVNVPVLVYEDESGGYWAEVPALPGCVSEGDTLDEVLANVREAAQGCVLARHDVETGKVRP
jgi:predicted RNase H-like HicB family nuclease